MVLHINLMDSAPPFKGGDSVFDSGISFICSSGGIGRHPGLKIPWAQARTGSSPVWSTICPTEYNETSYTMSQISRYDSSTYGKSEFQFIFEQCVINCDSWKDNTFICSKRDSSWREMLRCKEGRLDSCLLH